MKPYALHIPLSDRERKAILKRSKELGLTQGQYARKLMYGKLSGEEIMRRADTTNGTEVSVSWPKQKTMKLRTAQKEAVKAAQEMNKALKDAGIGSLDPEFLRALEGKR